MEQKREGSCVPSGWLQGEDFITRDFSCFSPGPLLLSWVHSATVSCWISLYRLNVMLLCWSQVLAQGVQRMLSLGQQQPPAPLGLLLTGTKHRGGDQLSPAHG